MESSQLYLPVAILLSSFLGSWHCAGMCGPFAALSGSKGQLWHYHAGRLMAYSALGALSGSFGEFVLKSEFVWLRNLGAVALAVVLLMMGLQYLLSAKNLEASHSRAGRFFQTLYRKLYRFKMSRSSFSLGLMAGLLPCMWLYTYVIAAASSKSAYAGSVVMTLFWLGGLPALSAVSMMIRPSLAKAHAQKQKVAGVVLVLSGVYALASHFLMPTLH